MSNSPFSGRSQVAATDVDRLADARYFVPLLKPYGGAILTLALASVGLSLLNGVTQVALTPLLEIVLRGSEAASSAAQVTPGFTFDLNQLGLSVLNLAAQATGFTDPWRLLLVSSGLYVVLAVAGQAAAFATRYWATGMRLRVSRDLEYKLFGHILRLPLSFLHRHPIGWLQSRMSGDVLNATGMINDLVIDGLTNVLLSGFYILLLVRTNPSLTLIAAIAGLTQLGLSRGLTNMARNRTRDNFEAMAQGNAFRQERLSAIREIKSFSAEQHEQESLFSIISRVVRLSVRYFLYKHVEKPLRISVNRVVVVVVMLFGAWQLLQGQITTSAFLLFMFFAQSLIGPLTGLASILLEVTEIRALLSGVAYLLAVDEEPNGTRPARADDFQDRIELKDVSFAYGDLPVLRNANLTIRKGEMVALVGRSGAGKSTLVDLLMRFYLPTDGVITLDGVQVGEFNLQQYRRLFGVVSQDELLFNDTVYNNIAYARPELSREDVERSARIANAEPFILSDLDNGYDTIVGQRGVRLSGGQRQRIAIARAVAHQPAVLILDEATSSLDSESERLVQQAIEQVVKGCTAVVIAHRLSTVLMADKIVVLKEGEIVEMGTHQELLNRGGEYRYLYDLQFDPNGARLNRGDIEQT
jgi:ABC-type multidrug transport system fused ATPase/permease subunit